MNILLLGSGGREHALAWKINQSPLCSKLYIAPGNAGCKKIGQTLDINPLDFDSIASAVIDLDIQMIVCGPEQPAVAGIWDYFNTHHPNIKVVAPSQKSAMLEGSKAYAKAFMNRHKIPTADYLEVNLFNFDEGVQWLNERKPPYVIKADGLAEGKGVVIAENLVEAQATLREYIYDKKFGNASSLVVLEEYLEGLEFSVFVYTDGREYQMLPHAKDYKRRYEGNNGLNTGGMGCVSPVPTIDQAYLDTVRDTIVNPTIKGLIHDDMPYMGFVYFGLIQTANGPKVIEYNCRLGDPETQVILPLIQSDILEMFNAGFEGKLKEYQLTKSDQYAATIILASDGYPGIYQKGFKIEGYELVNESIIFEAGTAIDSNENLITNGGRVMAITSLASTLDQALAKGYASIEKIKYQGKVYRKDIGFEFI